MAVMDEGHLFTVQDVARRLSVPVSWVYKQVEAPDCDIPHLRFGRYIRFEPAAIDEYVNRQRRGGPRLTAVASGARR